MTDHSQLAAEVAASAAAATGASKVTATGAGMAGLGWLTNSELIGLAGFIVAVIGMLVNWHYRRKEHRLRLIEHEADVLASLAERDYWKQAGGLGDG